MIWTWQSAIFHCRSFVCVFSLSWGLLIVIKDATLNTSMRQRLVHWYNQWTFSAWRRRHAVIQDRIVFRMSWCLLENGAQAWQAHLLVSPSDIGLNDLLFAVLRSHKLFLVRLGDSVSCIKDLCFRPRLDRLILFNVSSVRILQHDTTCTWCEVSFGCDHDTWVRVGKLSRPYTRSDSEVNLPFLFFIFVKGRVIWSIELQISWSLHFWLKLIKK